MTEQPDAAVATAHLGSNPTATPRLSARPPRGPAPLRSERHERGAPEAGLRPVVQISPAETVRRRTVAGRAITAELIRSPSHDMIECRYRAAADLLVAHEQWARLDGETVIEGAPRSRLRDLAHKLTFVPAGHDYFEWHRPRTPTRIMFFYLDAAGHDEQSAPATDTHRIPRVMFEDEVLWGTVLKLKGLMDGGLPADTAYLDALGAVLAHELLRPLRPADGAEASAKGGLAAWQQRAVAAYIEEHLAERIPLATLARLARLSPYHFSRAFKQSFGVPPHRYHTRRRIERAKTLLEDRVLSVTDIGLALGFSETSSFTAAFRKTTGVTPSRYHRSIG